MEAFPGGLHLRPRSRPHLHADQGWRCVSLPPRARVSLNSAPWAPHRLVRDATACGRFQPLSPVSSGALRGHDATQQGDHGYLLDAAMEGSPPCHTDDTAVEGWPLCNNDTAQHGDYCKNSLIHSLLDATPRPTPRLLPLLLQHFNGRSMFNVWPEVLWPKKKSSKIFRFDFSKLEQRVGQVIRHNSWEAYMGFPMEQTIPYTCTLVACTVCVEAKHRLEYETWHGPGTFPCRAAAPRKLRRACHREHIWTPRGGAYAGDVLKKIQELGGVWTTNAAAPAPCLLPLRSWQQHSNLSIERMAAILDRGPCVGSVWVCPWWPLFDASINDKLVYKGCGRNLVDMLASIVTFGPDAVGFHAVVCFAYRICPKEKEEEEDDDDDDDDDEEEEEEEEEVMHVLVMDNHQSTGPTRWVDSEELNYIYTVEVDRLEPPLHLAGRQLKYPRSGCYC